MTAATNFIRVEDPVPAEEIERIQSIDNNAMIIRLMFTMNHLSRWLTPIHDDDRLDRAVYRGEPTAKELVIRLRNYDLFIYPRLYLIVHESDPNFDLLELEPAPVANARNDSTVVLMASARRARQSITGLLRTLPDDAWDLRGRSPGGIEGSVRSLAEAVAIHDYRVLRALDQTLDQTGAREGVAEIQKIPLDELLRLAPEHVDIHA
jgi:hypothetical protein